MKKTLLPDRLSEPSTGGRASPELIDKQSDLPKRPLGLIKGKGIATLKFCRLKNCFHKNTNKNYINTIKIRT